MTPAPVQDRLNALVTWVRPVHAALRVLRVRPDGRVPAVRGGQHVMLGLEEGGRLIQRPFSVSSPILGEDGRLLDPAAEDSLEFYVAHDASAFTRRIMALQPGTRIWLSPRVRGRTTLDPVGAGDDVLLCATGTGEAPHNRMIHELLWAGHAGRIVSVVCCRYRRDLAYLDVHRELERMFAGYRYLPMTTRDVLPRRRYIQQVLRDGELQERAGLALDPSRTHVFLCGDPGMVGRPWEAGGRRTYPPGPGVVELLETGYGFCADGEDAPGNIHFERYA